MNMPQKDGGDVLRELRLKKCAPPVVMMTGDLSGVVLENVAQDLKVDMLSKPFTSASLLAKVKELIHEQH